MSLLPVALVAGALSVLAPCVVSLLPALIGRSLDGTRRLRSAVTVIAALCASIFVFSILLRASTALLSVPPRFWQVVAGVILVLFGVFTLAPGWWDRIAARLGVAGVGARGRDYGSGRTGWAGDVVLGASLGPVFSACSPTYAVIVAVILPASPLEGVVYLAAYLVGLAVVMLVVIIGGRRAVRAMGWSIDPHGWFKRILGVLFVVLGVAIATGLDKDLLALAVTNGWFDWQLDLEDSLR